MRARSLAAIASLLLASCGEQARQAEQSAASAAPAFRAAAPTAAARVYAVPAQLALSRADVGKVIARAVAEAAARGRPATIAVVDRVGNVLAVFAMNDARQGLFVPRAPNGSEQDIQGIQVPAAAAGAIAKAITGAYLSSGGNAFSTRTASMIVQEHFPPSVVARGLESGPLFGVQFSQLPCSDLAARFDGSAAGPGAFVGPKRSPLGLAADPGGFPLYKGGVLVGGVGVMADGVYGFDPEVQDVDRNLDEIVALAATTGYAAPEDIRANRITVDGASLRYSDASPAHFAADPARAPGFDAIDGRAGSLASVRGYFDASGGVLAGRVYGSEASGIRPSRSAEFASRDIHVLTDGSGANRFPLRGGTDAATVAQPLSRAEAAAVLNEAFRVMSRARAQIRRPLDSRAQVSISVVDTHGAVLGLVRAPDAPVFGIDVSVQKARTVAFFAGVRARAALASHPDGDVRRFAEAADAFFGGRAPLNGRRAFSARAIGNISRPFFPDGERGMPPGLFSRPIGRFNPFSTGLQSALVEQDIRDHVAFLLGAGPDVRQSCTRAADVAPGPHPLRNGIQIFPGAVPIYRGSQVVGAIGVSGDGIDQDDMISFLGLHNAGLRLGTIGNADPAIRSDRIVVPVGDREVRLRWVVCPFAPFLGTGEQNVCQGK
ncbi:MAG TPA: heme-binding protein [Allosphingosinicella sp.]|nr:heme-binding protein [Allosphingosinicella sp.]